MQSEYSQGLFEYSQGTLSAAPAPRTTEMGPLPTTAPGLNGPLTLTSAHRLQWAHPRPTPGLNGLTPAHIGAQSGMGSPPSHAHTSTPGLDGPPSARALGAAAARGQAQRGIVRPPPFDSSTFAGPFLSRSRRLPEVPFPLRVSDRPACSHLRRFTRASAEVGTGASGNRPKWESAEVGIGASGNAAQVRA